MKGPSSIAVAVDPQKLVPRTIWSELISPSGERHDVLARSRCLGNRCHSSLAFVLFAASAGAALRESLLRTCLGSHLSMKHPLSECPSQYPQNCQGDDAWRLNGDFDYYLLLAKLFSLTKTLPPTHPAQCCPCIGKVYGW